MPVERRGQVTHVRMESTGNRRNSLSWRKPAGFLLGWHEPDELRGSCPDLWGTRGEIPRVYPAKRSRHVWVREMSANDPLTKRRKDSDDSKTRVSLVSCVRRQAFFLISDNQNSPWVFKVASAGQARSEALCCP